MKRKRRKKRVYVLEYLPRASSVAFRKAVVTTIVVEGFRDQIYELFTLTHNKDALLLRKAFVFF